MLGLLAFIPLYPKLPLLDIRHTWVYVRIEDFVVLFVLFFWGILIVDKKISLRTPLTTPILLFWAIGVIATIHGLLLLFSALGDVHGNVALLSFIRRIEYMSLFFVAYTATRDKRFIRWVAVVLTITVLGVALYGIGQKYIGLPAFLTMNEEFAKGIPIRLSPLSRVSSTFGGHYDLAAYLVLVLPVLVSLVFGVKHWVGRGALLTVSLLGFVVMIMTVSRISLLALIFSVGLVVLVHKKKLVVFSLPIIILGALIMIRVSPGIVDRFGNTVKEIDVIVDATTGEAVGHSKNVPNLYFAQKQVRQVYSTNVHNLYAHASPSAALIVPFDRIEADPVLFVEPNAPTGENLPQGTGYINLPFSPVTRKLGHFYFEPIPMVATTSAEVFVINGSYILKKVLAYDLSFTTRFQGEWPRAMDTFRRNIFLGSGYGSVGLAVDNSYLRMLAEVGLLGLGAFMTIFIIAGMYIRRMLPDVDDPCTRSFIIGVTAGVMGLAVNALFIDVFEASKIAFVLWLLLGMTLGALGLYGRKAPDVVASLKVLISSPIAVAIYLFILVIFLYSSMTRNNFVGDDFTWLRWAAQTKFSDWYKPFIDSSGFFYRPGAKLYFLLMYSVFWLNQSAYHAVSLMLHFTVAFLVFLLTRKILGSFLLSTLASLAFLTLSGNAEPVFWISATGFMFTAIFSLSSLLFYISWEEKKKMHSLFFALVLFIFSLLFHELGIVTPLLIVLYKTIFFSKSNFPKLLLVPIPLYLFVRYIAQSHWLSGDYSYNLWKLPFNLFGNAVGYVALSMFGPFSIPMMQAIRTAGRNNMMIAGVVIISVGLVILRAWRMYAEKIAKEDRRISLFGLGFFVIALLPFLGLGNMTSRYSYLSSVGLVIILVYIGNRLYQFLLKSARAVAVLTVVIVSGTFLLLQLIQQQQMQRDWYDAGETARKFVVAMDGAYEDYWKSEPMEFHFVNVPIRIGEAWIFPVGLPDAIWLVFHNSAIRVFTWPTLVAAFDAVDYDSKNQKVFEFEPNGKLIERRKIRTSQ